MNKIYLDNAATTPLNEQVIEEMLSVMRNHYGNPSSTHSIGQEAKTLIENVRRKIAEYLRVTPSEIIFTSCGTESNNLIIKSCVEHLGVERIISSALEHKCVSESCLEMKNYKGVELVYLRPDKNGNFDLAELEKILKSSNKKTLVSLMHANNEIGNLLDIEKTAEICKQNHALFHSDTVQTVGHLDLDFSKIPIDFASCSAHKFHGPKGVGFAFVRKSSGLKGLIVGGTQERSLRAGTENVVGIVGLGKALELSIDNLEKSKLLGIKKDFLSRSLNEGFSGGEKKRNEIFQMLMLNPKLAILDETDSGLDIDALRIVSEGVNAFKNEGNAVLLITHYQRLLNYIQPDFVHVLADGKIIKTGDRTLALELEEKGYDWLLG